jgi:hypothetical protein
VDAAHAAELLDGRLGMLERLAVEAVLVLDCLTPFPFSVRAITTVGFPVVDTAAANASSIASTS